MTNATAGDAIDTATTEIHRADPNERRRNLILMVLVAVVGALLMAAMLHELGSIREHVQAGDADIAAGRFLWLARGSFVVLALVGVITGAIIAQGALAVIREQRYPHSGARLVHDRKVTRGPRAVVYGRLGLLLAAGFALVGCAGAAIGWQLLQNFK